LTRVVHLRPIPGGGNIRGNRVRPARSCPHALTDTAVRTARGYVVTTRLDDFGLMQDPPAPAPGAEPTTTQIMRMPAPVLCYWMGATEIPEADG